MRSDLLKRGARRLCGSLSVILTAAGLHCVALKDGGMSPPGGSDGAAHETVMPDGSVPSGAAILPGSMMQDGSMDEGSPDANDSIDAVAAADAESPPSSPATIESSHLRLWLNAEVGVACRDHRVSSWTDSSSDHRDATLQRGQLGPECQVSPTPHVVNGVDLPYFSAPETVDAGPLDETLDVDLTFLQGSNYTIFALERRWADGTPSQTEFVLGTTLPAAVIEAGALCSNPNSFDVGLALGYVYYHGGPQFVEDQSCTALYADSPPVAAALAAGNLLVERAVRFDNKQGHQIWMKGTLLSADSDTTPIGSAQRGAIGRAFLDWYPPVADQRFKGDISEVIAYDAALSDTDLIAVESYLHRHWNN